MRLLFYFSGLIGLLNACASNQTKVVNKLDLINSKWKINYNFDETEPIEFHFEMAANGKLKWKHPHSEFISENSFWSINSDTLILTTNSEYAIYKGIFVNRDSIYGQAINQKYENWNWTAIRIRD